MTIPNPLPGRRARFLAGASLGMLALAAFAAEPAKINFDVPADKAERSLKAVSVQSGVDVVFISAAVANVTTHAVKGELTPTEALTKMLAGTGLVATREGQSGAFVVKREAADPNAPRAAQAANRDRPSDQNNQPEQKAVVLDTFEVFGSKLLNMDIPRSRDDAQPYVIFGRAAIEQSGTDSLDEFLKLRLPMNTTALLNGQIASSLGTKSTINLRGLGQAQTLILVDGHRMADYYSGGAQQQPDVNGIPLGAIERVEILPTTASGIYGGGATGGVINIVLRRDYAGAEVKTRYENPFHSDASSRRFDLSAGVTLEGGKTNLLLAASYVYNNQLLVQDRNFTQLGRARLFANNPGAILSTGSPILGATTNIRSATGTNLVLKNGTALNSPFTFVPRGYAGAATDGGAAFVANAGRYNLALANSAQGSGGARQTIAANPEVESLTATARRQFSPRLQAFVEGAAANNTAWYRLSPLAMTVTIPTTVANNPFQQNIQATIPGGPDSQSKVMNYSRRVVGGVIAKLPVDWKLDADVTWSRSREAFIGNPGVAATATTAFINGTLDVLRDTDAFPFSIAPYLMSRIVNTPVTSTLRDLNVRLAGPVGRLPGGPIALAASFENARVDFSDGFQYVPPATATYFARKSQLTRSGYLEARVPVFSALNQRPGLRELELQLAGRQDDYMINGTGIISNPTPTTIIPSASSHSHSANPTVALRWKPVEAFTLRASYGTGFLPPTVVQVLPNTPTVATTTVIDPRRGNTSVVLPAGTVFGGGNPNLTPEKSKSWSVGGVLTSSIMPGLRFSVDYSRIDKTNNIQTLTAQQIVDNESFIAGRVARGPNLPTDQAGWAGPITGLNLTLTNLAKAKLEAYDVALDYHREVGAGSFDVFVAASWEPHYQTQIAPTAPMLENAGITFNSPLKFRGNGGVTWKYHAWTAGWSVSYFDSYLVANPTASTAATTYLNQGGTSVPAQAYHDVFVSYRIGSNANWLLRRTEVQVGVRNVFNHAPPFDASYPNYYYSVYGDPRMARYSLSVRKAF